MNFEIIPPIVIEGKNSVVGITNDPTNDLIKINHHYRSIPDNKDHGDFKEVAFSKKHLPILIQQLSKYIDSEQQNK